MSDYEKTNVPNMMIDKTTGAVINNDMGAYQAIKKAREEKRKSAELADRVSLLEHEVQYLKQAIKDYMGRHNGLEDNRD